MHSCLHRIYQNPVHIIHIDLLGHVMFGMLIISSSLHAVGKIGHNKVYLRSRVLFGAKPAPLSHIFEVQDVYEAHKSYRYSESAQWSIFSLFSKLNTWRARSDPWVIFCHVVGTCMCCSFQGIFFFHFLSITFQHIPHLCMERKQQRLSSVKRR